jgi:hypothetical protein
MVAKHQIAAGGLRLFGVLGQVVSCKSVVFKDECEVSWVNIFTKLLSLVRIRY